MLRFIYRFFMNFLWKLTGGIIFSLLWIVIGLVFSLTIVFLPRGIDCFRIAYFTMKPFGREVIVTFSSHYILNVIWVLFVGSILTILSFLWLLALTISILGIPLIYQWYKVVKVTLFPFGVVIV